MIKWIIGVVLALAIGYLLITYVPGVKFWEKQRTQETATQNQLQTEKAGRAKAEKDLAEYKKRIESDAYKSQTELKSLLPSLQLQIKQMSQQMRRQAILTSLVNQKLLASSDTVTLKGVGEYTPVQEEAIGVKIGICDSIQQKLTNVLKDHSLTIDLSSKRADSLAKWIAWSERGKWIAETKGIATGRNKRLRQHTLNPPL